MVGTITRSWCAKPSHTRPVFSIACVPRSALAITAGGRKALTSRGFDGNQALSAVLFLYRDVLDLDVPWLDGIARAKRPQRLPVVLTRDEVRAVLRRVELPTALSRKYPNAGRE
jgi:integrase